MLPGRTFAYEHLGLNGPDGVVPDIEPGRVESGTFASAARGTEVGYEVIFPPGDEDPLLPVVVALHWLGADAATLTSDRLGLDRYLAQHVADGGAPFVIAAVDGGRGYWHPHDGDDAGAMVLDEFLPLLQERGGRRAGSAGSAGRWAGTARSGWPASAGADATSAVAVASPALWSDPDEASPDGFSDAAEYREYTVFDRQDDLAGIPRPHRHRPGRPVLLRGREVRRGAGRRRRRSSHRAGRAHPRLLAPDAARPARPSWAERLAAAAVEGDVPVVALVGVDVARGRLVHRRTVTAHPDVGVGAVHPRGQAGGAREVELVAVGVAVGAARVAGLRAAGDGQPAAAGVLEGDRRRRSWPGGSPRTTCRSSCRGRCSRRTTSSRCRPR